MVLRDRVPRGVSVVLLGLGMLSVPLFDIWEDIFVGGKPPLSTLLENVGFVALSLALLTLAGWLLQNDWPDRYVVQATKWSFAGTVGITLMFAWVFVIQVFVQNDLKPYIIAADGVVIGSLAALIAGVYNARSAMESDALEAERDRFSALFDNTSDCIAAFEFREERPVVTDVNATYRETFGDDRRAVGGDSERRTLYLSSNENEVDAREHFERIERGEEFQTAVRRETVDGTGDFLVSVVPARASKPPETVANHRPDASIEGFAVFTDITDQRDRERQLETLSEANADLVAAGAAEEVFAAACEVATSLFADSVVSVWSETSVSGRSDVTGADAAEETADPVPWRCSDDATDDGALRPVVGRAGDRAGGRADVLGPRSIPLGAATDAFDAGEVRVVDGGRNEGDDGSWSEGDDGAGRDGTVGDDHNLEHDDDHELEHNHNLDHDEWDGESAFLGPFSGAHLLCVTRTSGSFSAFEQFVLDVLLKSVESAVDRLTREEQLQRRNDQLEFLNSLLRHDIQNSMTVIRARAEFLAEGLDGREADFATTIVDQSDDVTDLVDRFRVMLDALSGDAERSLEPVALRALLRERADRLRATFPETVVDVALPEEPVSVRADETLENVVDNVLTNAVEHNDTEEPHVDVTLSTSQGTAHLSIADDGPGIPDEEKEVVFRRGESGMKDQDLGSGFGLFFVDTMVRRYGGSVDVRDNEPRGSVFEFELPLASVEEREPSEASTHD